MDFFFHNTDSGSSPFLYAIYAPFTVICPAPVNILKLPFLRTAAAFPPGPFPVIRTSGLSSKSFLAVSGPAPCA